MRRASSRERGRDRRAPRDGRDGGDEGGEDERVDEADLRNKEFGDIEGRKTVRRRASELLGESRPAVRGVPGDEGGENRQRDGEPGEQRRRGEPAAQRRRGGQGEADAGGEKDGGELRLQRQAERQPERDQPARLAGAPELDEGRKAEGPEHHQRRVGGDEDRADEDERHRDPHQRRERGLFRRAEQTPGDQRDEGRHRADDKERKRPHADFGAAEQRRRGADEEGDHRRMVEVSERKRPRPQRIIGFVESKLEPPGDERLRGQERNRRGEGAKAEPTGAARPCFGPRGGDDGRIAAHLVVFALLSAVASVAAVRGTQARFAVNRRPRRVKALVANRENGAKVLRSAHRRLAADVV